MCISLSLSLHIYRVNPRFKDSHLFEFRHEFERGRLQVVDIELTRG